MEDDKDLCQRLGSDDPVVLREAAFEAADAGCEEAVPLLARLLCSSSLGVQEAADMALRKMGGKAVVDAVIPLLRSDEAPARNLAMDILRDVGNEDFPSLVALLHDASPDIRIFASDILGATESRMAVTPLCDALLRDPEVNVRYQAAVSLGELAYPEAAKCLGKAMEDEEWVQFAVIEALSKIRDASSVGALVKALNKSSDLVSSMIVEALGEIGNVKAVTMLLKRMDASPTVLRNKIVKAVVRILGGKSLTLLTAAERERFRDYLLAALADDDEDIQDAAVDGLAFVGGETASAAVLDLASRLDKDADPERYDRALTALRSIGLTAALERGLLKGDEPVRRTVLDALSALAGPRVSDLLMKAFAAAGPDLRQGIAHALSGIAGPEAKAFFLGLLDAEDEAVLKEALGFLGVKLRLAEAGERIFRLLSHPADTVKEAALEACVAIDGPELAERFRALFTSSDPVERLMAIYALGRIGVRDNIEEIKKALDDEVPDIRKIALEALAEICGHETWGLPLIESKLADENRDVRLAVVELLGNCVSEGATATLLGALTDGDDWVRARAVEALGARRDAAAVPRLVELTTDASKLVALKAVESLGEIGGMSAFRALLDIIAGEDPELAAAAEAAIAKIQDEQGASE